MPDDDTQTATLKSAPTPRTAPDLRAPRLPDANEPPAPWLLRLIAVGLVLAALNLRPAITSLGALLEEVRDGLHMSGSVAGVLTSVPPLCFAVFGVMAPRLARRFGAGAVVCAGMAAIAIGVGIRPYVGSTAGFLAASALALMGIAVSNILMPVIVKRWFPDRVGSMTGLYSMALALGTALAAALTVPVTGALGGNWQTGLAVWAGLAAAAVLPWIVLVRDRTPAPAPAVPVPAASGADAPALRITRSRTAWALACFFGLQATAAYITMGWMPQIFRDAGVSAGTAGLLLAVTMAMGVPLAFVIPRVASRLRQQGPIVVVLGLCGLIGYGGLYLAPAAGAWAWALLLGVANCAFPLALTMIGMRARSGAGVVRLSAFAQSTGYLISIPGPLLVGVLYQHSGGWGLPIALMAGLMIPQMAVGFLAGRDRTIEDEC
ncbi:MULTISPECIES: CynX/NimT family MFS transporter [Streptomyces]|uniref:CynX/NimT family MFS transporter n=3 Tax=Streptomyces TaxID=1883 RepID=A0A927GNV5_STRGL|nr:MULTISPECIES: CynX/NimT family MFS transporter [Streptomyces]MBD2829981.1 CynX/NimT family MFS transporter [Streptomyces globisporus]MYW79012.1 CynX/NimT family MFS transporter [Streptomyces sp. SID8369]NEC44753.1 CynX/NimT family MFS transporter [Streptomyces sp. SID8016]ARF61008.1 cyanate MFS transporter [Streptomyces violaceoruber]KOG83226.1 transporter [Streptomyces griseus subsp. rhodochrous]